MDPAPVSAVALLLVLFLAASVPRLSYCFSYDPRDSDSLILFLDNGFFDSFRHVCFNTNLYELKGIEKVSISSKSKFLSIHTNPFQCIYEIIITEQALGGLVDAVGKKAFFVSVVYVVYFI